VSKGRILLFGRDSKRLLWRADLVRRLGFTPFISEDLTHATTICREVTFSAAVISYGLDPMERADALRRLHRDCRVPVILITQGRLVSGARADACLAVDDEQHQLESVLQRVLRGADSGQTTTKNPS
jgi:DNA-binding NtrC family response regulator